MLLHDIPGPHSWTCYVPAHLAATATETIPIFRAPFKCKIIRIRMVPNANVTGQATNYTNINIINKGTDGTGNTELANRDYSGAGVTETAYVARTLYEPATPTVFAEGTVIIMQYEKVGTGLDLPCSQFIVEYEGA